MAKKHVEKPVEEAKHVNHLTFWELGVFFSIQKKCSVQSSVYGIIISVTDHFMEMFCVSVSAS